MRLTASGGKKSKSNGSLPELPAARKASPAFVVCRDNAEYPASLEIHKIYPVIAEPGLPEGLVRVVDASGEDYVYPANLFVPIKLTPQIREALKLAS